MSAYDATAKLTGKEVVPKIPLVPWKPAAGAARLARAAFGGCLVFLLTPIRAQEPPLQASFADRLYVLVDQGERWTLAESGRDPLVLPGDGGETFTALTALDRGWLAAGHRAAGGRGLELVLLAGDDAGVSSLPVPPIAARGVASPQPVIENGTLQGLVWLEGDDARSLGVRAASWTGAGFAAAEWVSPPAETGSQLSLSATVLRDGRWLLVWSAFDGADDEIVWSLRDGPTWTPPARLHAANGVPDITPVVAAAGRGAVAAWSRYEAGHYRVRVARFRAGAWSDEERVGPAGSAFPFFVVDAAGRAPSLVFPSASRTVWDLLELDAAGQVRRRSRWDAPSRERPLVRRGSAGALALRWLSDASSPGAKGDG